MDDELEGFHVQHKISNNNEANVIGHFWVREILKLIFYVKIKLKSPN
jgi:hypothetical protein